jgi:hypothetical protein
MSSCFGTSNRFRFETFAPSSMENHQRQRERVSRTAISVGSDNATALAVDHFGWLGVPERPQRSSGRMLPWDAKHPLG